MYPLFLSYWAGHSTFTRESKLQSGILRFKSEHDRFIWLLHSANNPSRRKVVVYTSLEISKNKMNTLDAFLLRTNNQKGLIFMRRERECAGILGASRTCGFDKEAPLRNEYAERLGACLVHALHCIANRKSDGICIKHRPTMHSTHRWDGNQEHLYIIPLSYAIT